MINCVYYLINFHSAPEMAKMAKKLSHCLSETGHLSMPQKVLLFFLTLIIYLPPPPAQTATPTLWAGTNNGGVYAFTIAVPNTNKRKDESPTCQLAKEIQLKHRAPVIGITVLDPDPSDVRIE